jgi:hypothetical protein
MRRRVDAQRQPGDDGDARTAGLFGKPSCVLNALGRGIAAADHGQRIARQQCRIAAHVEQQGDRQSAASPADSLHRPA